MERRVSINVFVKRIRNILQRNIVSFISSIGSDL